MEERGRAIPGWRGFTLVELLVVIVIIGVLTAMLMMTMGASASRAKASKIVGDMRTIKGAAVMYAVDNDGWYGFTGDGWGVASVTVLASYLSGAVEDAFPFNDPGAWNTARKNRYFLYISGPGTSGEFATDDYHVYVAANVTDDYVDYGVREQLEKLSPKAGIYNGDYSEWHNTDSPVSDYYFEAKKDPGSTADSYVLMNVY